MKFANFLMVALLAYAPLAWSQCGYAVNTGGGNCVPPDAVGMPAHDYNADRPQQAVQPAPKWADQWGAIAIDSTSGHFAPVVDRPTKSDAVRDATQECASRGSTHCKVVVEYYNQCVALAYADGMYATASGPDLRNTQQEAKKSCDKSGPTCEVVYSACSVARRVQ